MNLTSKIYFQEDEPPDLQRIPQDTHDQLPSKSVLSFSWIVECFLAFLQVFERVAQYYSFLQDVIKSSFYLHIYMFFPMKSSNSSAASFSSVTLRSAACRRPHVASKPASSIQRVKTRYPNPSENGSFPIRRMKRSSRPSLQASIKQCSILLASRDFPKSNRASRVGCLCSTSLSASLNLWAFLDDDGGFWLAVSSSHSSTCSTSGESSWADTGKRIGRRKAMSVGQTRVSKVQIRGVAKWSLEGIAKKKARGPPRKKIYFKVAQPPFFLILAFYTLR